MGENRVECEACGKRRTDTEFSTRISVLPPYLFVQLKRFDFNLRTMRQEKLNHEVVFPFELDLWPYTLEAPSMMPAPKIIPEAVTTSQASASTSFAAHSL